MKIIILGSGLVGSPMAIDLARDDQHEISVADINKKSLEQLKKRENTIRTIPKNLSNPVAVKQLVKDHDMVVNAVPGFLGFQTLKAVIEAKKDVVDIAFFPEDPFLLDDLAKKNQVTAVVDCGVAPGMSNILTGYADHLLDKTEKVTIYVGGLPEVREWPFEYKAVFSPLDVIEEYTRPARYVENGSLVTKPALSEPELINFPGIGTLEAFNSDGLRTLINTIKAPNLKEKTMRYPGHIEKVAILREIGFFSKEKIEIEGKKIRPLDFTSKLLFPKWKFENEDRDITVMKVIIEGEKKSRRLKYTYNLLDRFDETTNTHSMAKTTGYTATMTVRAILAGLYEGKGISAPEFIGKNPTCVHFILNGLKDRGINYRENISDLN